MRVSVSEIQAGQLCQYKHYLAYERRLEPLGRDPRMASGSAVHATVATLLTDRTADTESVARAALEDEFRTDPYGDESVARFLPGVLRAVKRVPDWVWAKDDWHVEELFEYTPPTVTPPLVVRMKPDLYRVTETTVDIVEIKTTARDPLDYLLSSPQHEWYGLGLADRYPDKLVRFQYVCVPTGERDKVPFGHTPWVLTKQRLAAAREELIVAAEGLRRAFLAPRNRGFWCPSCPFFPVCTAHVTGGDTEDVIQSLYREREPRGT